MIRAFLENERGATLTELVICLPMMIVCFYGIIYLGAAARELNVVESVAYHNTMDQAVEEQRRRMLSIANMDAGLTHAMPSVAAIHAMRQLEAHPPRQKGAARHLLVVSEMANYSFGGIALSGHFGESYARTRMPRLLGMGMAGVDDAATSSARPLMGTSVFARQIVDDSPGQNYKHERERARKPGFLQGVLNFLNTGLDAAGGRAAFAAGIRYGTETGHHRASVGAGPFTFQSEAYYNVTVAPYTSILGKDQLGGGDGLRGRGLDSMRATAVIRMTMADHPHYNEIFGFNGLQNSTRSDGGADVTQRIGFVEGSYLVGDTQIQTQQVDQIGFAWPMNYDASLVGDN